MKRMQHSMCREMREDEVGKEEEKGGKEVEEEVVRMRNVGGNLN